MTAHLQEDGEMTLMEIATALGGLGIGGMGTALLGKWLGRRQERVDMLLRLEEISGRLTERAVAQADERVAAAEQRVHDLEIKLTEHTVRDNKREARRQLAAAQHTAWDMEVAQRLRDLGQPVSLPPPLE